MAYATGNPRTKAELKRRVAAGDEVRVFSVGFSEPEQDGVEYIEGPQYPQPHRWYAQVTVEGGRITGVK
jgi:hypothetical protein